MHNKELKNKEQKFVKKYQDEKMETEPFLQWKFKYNEKTCKNEFESLTFSDGSELNDENFKMAVKKATGTPDLSLGELILRKAAYGMAAEELPLRLNEVSALLPALNPKDETEALLLGQFLALHDSGFKCLRLANLPDQGFYHVERLFLLANKLLNTANQTMQTITKYRTGGQQTVQVVHMHNEGQAIVAQNISTSSREGLPEKNEN